MSSLGLGEAAGEFTDVTGADQLARGRVTAGRHGPVIAGCAAAPHPPLRVLAREPVKVGILIVPAWAGRHGGRRQAADGRPRCWRPVRPGAWMAGFSIRSPPDGAICLISPVHGEVRQPGAAGGPPGYPLASWRLVAGGSGLADWGWPR